MNPVDRLRYHVSGAIARGEAEAIVERPVMRITPTRHCKLEWSRLAQAAYSQDRNDVGHRFSGAASILDSQSLSLATYDSLQHDYRVWLIDNQFPV